MVAPRAEKAYEKYAWIIPFLLGITGFIGWVYFTLIGPLSDPDLPSIAGTTWNELSFATPRVASYIAFTYRSLGVVGLVGSFSQTAISLKSYRRGEKWSWYALWFFSVVVGLGFILLGVSYGASNALIANIVFLVLSLLGLLLPYRKFFPRKP